MSERVTSGERIQFYRDQAGEWRWRWIAANDSDQWADSGEGYGNKVDMLEGAFHVRGDRDIPDRGRGRRSARRTSRTSRGAAGGGVAAPQSATPSDFPGH